jgi:hypothetical protein
MPWSQLDTMLLQRYAMPSIERARAQFTWRPQPLVMFWMPIQVCGGGLFELLPDGMKPRKRDWHWVLAARHGLPYPDHSATGRVNSGALEARLGECIVDLVACPPDLSKPIARLYGAADVLGCPDAGWIAVDPVRIHSTPLAWLASGCHGVVPVGDEIGVQSYLRDCRAGIIADNVAHGEALLMKMRRELPSLPKVLVAA